MKFTKTLAAGLTAAVMLGTAFPAGASADDYFLGFEQSAAATNGTAAAEPAVTVAPKLRSQKSYGRVKVTWQTVPNAEKYYVYYVKPDGKYKQLCATTKTSFSLKNLEENCKYTFVVAAVRGTKGRAAKITVSPAKMQAYRLANDTRAYSLGSGTIVDLRSGCYSGYIDNISYNNYYVLYARDTTVLVSRSSANLISDSGKMLSCGALSQLDGVMSNDYACGPAAAAIFVTASTGRSLSVEQAISDVSRYGATRFSDPTFLTDGMPLKGIAELVNAELSRFGTGKSVRVVKSGSKTKARLEKEFKSIIDGGSRILVCTRDDSDDYSARTVQGYGETGATHYVVITGYDTDYNGNVYFYTGNSWYHENDDYSYANNHNHRNRSSARYYYGLCRSSAGELTGSVAAAARLGSDFGSYFYIG